MADLKVRHLCILNKRLHPLLPFKVCYKIDKNYRITEITKQVKSSGGLFTVF